VSPSPADRARDERPADGPAPVVTVAALGADLAARAGIDPPPAVVVRPAPRGGRRSLAAARLGSPGIITVTERAAATLPDWRLAAVIAHELGHLGQDRRRLEAAQLVLGGALVIAGVTAAASLAGIPGAPVALVVAVVALTGAAAVFLPESKRLEYAADRFGAPLVGTETMAAHLDLVAAEHLELPGVFHVVVAHPPSRRRAARLRAGPAAQ
jgi:Zn-dependent protease with chaperone function